MKKILLETSFSKIYMIVMVIITLLILGGYFSYAMFTVSKEKSNAISIVTGNLTYKLEVDGEEGNTLTVPSNTVKDFTITLSNPNNRTARFNFYYVGSLASNTKVGYIVEDGTNTFPDEKGINLEKEGTVGSSNTYIIRVINNSGKSVTVNLGVSVGLDYNDLSLPENGHLFEEITYKGEVGTVVLSNISKDNTYDDGVDTFTTGQYPNNYIWYSGKLWRAVSVNNEEKTVKLVTQWNISTISYDNDSSAFAGSYMEEWLNDTTVDGFLGNLREPEKFIKIDSKWNASMMNDISKPPSEEEGGTIVEDAVGLLNVYEYVMSGDNGSYSVNDLYWWTLTPYDANSLWRMRDDGLKQQSSLDYSCNGVRPAINLKTDVKIVDGDGTIDNPYRLEGDNDTNLEGTLLNTRYSGEYISFGAGENNLYIIVSHETDKLTKITSAEPLKENENYKKLAFGNNSTFSTTSTMGLFLNGEYLTSSNYITNEQASMIEENSTWYLGTVTDKQSYKLAKYTDENMAGYAQSTKAKVGLLRYGELTTGQFDSFNNNSDYWTLSPADKTNAWYEKELGNMSANYGTSNTRGIRPALNLKSNVIITGGDGTLQNPFTLS